MFLPSALRPTTSDSLFLFYPCTKAAAAVGTTPDVLSIISSPNWRAFRFNALSCFSLIWASYSS